MGPSKKNNTGARFEQMIDSLFWGSDSPDLEAEEDEYAEYHEDEETEDDE